MIMPAATVAPTTQVLTEDETHLKSSMVASTVLRPTTLPHSITANNNSRMSNEGVVSGGGGGVSANNNNNNNNNNTSTARCMVECAGCGTSINDRYYMSADDRQWHGSCLKCSHCKTDLQEESSCFQRDGQIFCKSDYYRIFSMRRCNRCGEGIYASELVMRVRDQNVYHIQCFTCAWCNVTLSQGDLYGLRDNLVYCRTHFEMLAANSSSSAVCFPPTNSILGFGPTGLPPSVTPVAVPLGGPTSVITSVSELGNMSHSHSHHSHLHDSLAAEAAACSSLAVTPYASSGLYSSIGLHGGGLNSGLLGGGCGGGVVGVGGGPPSNQSPTTPTNIRKGRPRKRKNVEQQHHSSEAMLATGGNSACQHESSMSPTIRSAQSPGSSNLDGGPLSGLAASIENSCLVSSQLSGGGLSLGSHSGQRTKRMRTSFKHHQLRTMKTYFNVNQNPDAKDLKQLAQKTGLSKRVLQVWFQNARAKWRRNNLKMLPDGQELSLNGQTLLALGHPSTPSTVIGSPNGSTRPFSSPSPVMSPPGDTMSSGHQSSSLAASQGSLHSQSSAGIEQAFNLSQNESSLLPIGFQELY